MKDQILLNVCVARNLNDAYDYQYYSFIIITRREWHAGIIANLDRNNI